MEAEQVYRPSVALGGKDKLEKKEREPAMLGQSGRATVATVVNDDRSLTITSLWEMV
jgi:hypothetical protein